MTKEEIVELIKSDNWMMEILRTTKTLDLPDWYIGAGFIRSKVWDTLHGYSKRTSLPDVDVIYFNKTDFTANEANNESTKAEILYEKRLKKLLPEVEWSVTNQARMHLFHKTTPYKSSEEALSEWVETATCFGVRLDNNNQLILSAPRGVDDLVNLVLRPISDTPEAVSKFHQRIEDKKWLEKWPKLRVIT
ncbi:MAG: hypothetical protein US68_C0011G0022 [Candidatus Shapirobacteria bacterium GW2011_GWE1_38_10]|uniref:Nucleotidyltransferase family protein n=1 Tax=Candidatus Shapirobacteria bacterium GW2011_GWE1_38_10 TaxID=1618488 RepID=A0A0G0IFG3_9BACT|nr:MAG: hypothetical protein US46_C0006G0022 [Candidatus Shapirobacteria bacterium GW2011_GWF2_37_20]KKQ49715.1 MAG: hypothetical protein US68_C0011G0022 [Candidatus Shapirobacteria bacterium GW2011_GWE1_38_10]KKQ64424.1 MAG: hypothetical protein US85_C0009G0013 [Candidatus Shapirobacteria bacterium GW2011_GWF1_38_23]HBP51643.1 hypothetical protein [Candidatus Shapirobacteria bacterium]